MCFGGYIVIKKITKYLNIFLKDLIESEEGIVGFSVKADNPIKLYLLDILLLKWLRTFYDKNKYSM